MRPATKAIFTAALLQALLNVFAQAPPPPADSEHPIPPGFAGVYRAWLIREEDLQPALKDPRASLEQFAVAAMVSHDTGKPVGETEKWRIHLGSWTEVIRTQCQYLKELVFKDGTPKDHHRKKGRPGMRK
jgi:hypothetical protein